MNLWDDDDIMLVNNKLNGEKLGSYTIYTINIVNRKKIWET